MPYPSLTSNALTLLSNISWKLQLVLLYTGCLQLKILHLQLVLVLLGFSCHCGWKSGSIHPAKLWYTWSLQCSSAYCYRMCVHGITLLAEWVGAALARVKFGCNQLCLSTTNPAPADLLPLYNLEVWSALHLLQTQWSIEQGSEPQCRPFCHGVTIHNIFPLPHVLNYANCLWHLHYWNMEIHVSTKHSTVTCIKYLQ